MSKAHAALDPLGKPATVGLALHLLGVPAALASLRHPVSRHTAADGVADLAAPLRSASTDTALRLRVDASACLLGDRAVEGLAGHLADGRRSLVGENSSHQHRSTD